MKASHVLALAALLLQASLCGADSSSAAALPAGMSCDDRVPAEVGAWATDADVNATGRETGWLSEDTCSTCAGDDRCPTSVTVDETGTITNIVWADYSKFDGLFDCTPGGTAMTMVNSSSGKVTTLPIHACSQVPTGALWLLVAIGGMVIGVPLAFSAVGFVNRTTARLFPKPKGEDDDEGSKKGKKHGKHHGGVEGSSHGGAEHMHVHDTHDGHGGHSEHAEHGHGEHGGHHDKGIEMGESSHGGGGHSSPGSPVSEGSSPHSSVRSEASPQPPHDKHLAVPMQSV